MLYSDCFCLFSLLFSQSLAHVEAFIDFSEDELIEEGVLDQGMNEESYAEPFYLEWTPQQIHFEACCSDYP